MNDSQRDVPDARVGVPDLEDKAAVLADVTDAIGAAGLEEGRRLLTERYPFTAVEKSPRSYTERRSLRLFYRDGFLDRYSGTRLVNPGALRLLSVLLPDDFPADPNWAMSRSHFAFWELFPTIDHLHPVSRGGEDTEANWVTTSMLRNSAKAHWTLTELGWGLHPSGDHAQWDGLTDWFVQYLRANPGPIAVPYIGRWFRASVEIQAEFA